MSGQDLGSDQESMRLDLFLKRTRLVKRRAIVKKMCEAGLIQVNGKTTDKPARPVKAGDRIVLPGGRLVRVKDIPAEKSIRDPGQWYELVPSGPRGEDNAGTD